MTVVIGVVTVAVVPVGVVTVTAVTGVATVTVAGEVGTGTVGTDTVGTASVEGDEDGAAVSAGDEPTDTGVTAPPEPRVDAGTASALE